MPFRDFFILLGVLAVTALVTVVVVETAVNRAAAEADGNPQVISAPPSSTSMPDGPAAGATIDTGGEVADESVAEPGAVTRVSRYRLEVKSAGIRIGGRQISGETGHILVQEARGDPKSPTVQLPVARLLSTSRSPQSPVFLLLDGPGLTNLRFDQVPLWLLEQHDIVLVGYRGVDGVPSLNIPETRQVSLFIQNNSYSQSDVRNLQQAIGNGLQRLSAAGVDLRRYTASQVVADIEEVREAFDYPAINLLAVGYGSWIASLYSQQYPEHARSNVLYSPLFSIENVASTSAFGQRSWGDVVLKLKSLYGDVARTAPAGGFSLIHEVLASIQIDIVPVAVTSVSAPTLLLIGGRDATATPEAVDRLLGALGQGRVVVLENVSRAFEPFVFQSRAFQDLLGNFLAEER